MLALKGRRLSAAECASVFAIVLFAIVALVCVLNIVVLWPAWIRSDFFLFDFQLRYNELDSDGFSPCGVNPSEISSAA